ncbi:CvpA family protein [Novosphingobium sp. Chol11]|uniref:CvpA family protein n=1 Tax=Novosphingobium sp. Chol11 TaxID=1385763 RepID=UPI0025F23460|nr:CvpA family protein [Novosphingobium sp. Chol11]
MTGFDYVVLLVIAVCAIGGFFRGFVEEVLSLAAWCIALIAVHTLHEPLTLFIAPYLKNETGAGLLAFALLMIIPAMVGRFAARSMGSASRNSLLGPIDRVLGFGFGAVKGFIIMVLAFSLVVFTYDVVWGPDGRPAWIAQARTYPFLNAASEELMTMIASRRAEAVDAAADKASEGSSKAKPSKQKAKRKPAPVDA